MESHHVVYLFLKKYKWMEKNRVVAIIGMH